ncbi:MAG: M20/M25/M40 family metallo-hydrolase, partial [Nitrososphaerales archaeon]
METQSQAGLERALPLLSDTHERRTIFCEKALSIYSPSGDERDLARFLFSELKEQGHEPLIDRAGNVICEVGSGSVSILFCGHMDTVPGELPVRREGSTLYGRGACDAKGPLLSMLFAFEDIASEFKSDPEKARSGNVIFAGVTEEERNSRGLNELIRNKVRADGAIFGEPCGVNRVTIGYRGHVPVKVVIETREVHGSAPWLASNAAELAFSIYQKIKAQWPSERPQSTGAVSVALTQLHSGSVHNVTPGRATMTLDIRVPSGVSTNEVASKVQSAVLDFNSSDVKASVNFGYSTEPY